MNELPEDIDLDIKKHRENRSLDANAYCWVLLGKLAEAINVPPEDIYRELIRQVGGNYEVTPVRFEAVKKWREAWERNGIGWVCASLGDSKIQGYENIVNYFGSSTYDSKQMARLIDLVIEECKGLGIETATPLELSRLKEEWGNANEKDESYSNISKGA